MIHDGHAALVTGLSPQLAHNHYTSYLACILGLYNVYHDAFAQSAAVWTHLFTKRLSVPVIVTTV
jgi:hypothetical protein